MKEDGFTLVEILVSIVILMIIMIGFFQLFIHTNKTAVHNNEKIVAINLAKATIERMKVAPFSYIEEPEKKPDYIGKDRSNAIKYDFNKCSSIGKLNCEQLYKPEINDQTYIVEIEVNQDSDEMNMKLINAVVTVSLPDKNIRSSVEGYVTYE